LVAKVLGSWNKTKTKQHKNQTKQKTMASPQGRNPELRKDSVTKRWVIFSPARAKRPSDFKSRSPTTQTKQQQECPFCLGHEHECAPEIFRVPSSSGPAWKIRVIENLYPALSRTLDGPFAQNHNPNASGSGDQVLGGFGFHDVVIENPVHSVQLSDQSPQELGEVLLVYKKRIQQLATHDSIKYVQVLAVLQIFQILEIDGFAIFVCAYV
jgi:UDPglucose--hexose-1-phosphate uridylyltransferase